MALQETKTNWSLSEALVAVQQFNIVTVYLQQVFERNQEMQLLLYSTQRKILVIVT